MSDRRRHDLGPGVTGYSGALPTRDELERMMRAGARDAGCTCTPDVEVPDNYGARGELAHVVVRHDDDCPLVA